MIVGIDVGRHLAFGIIEHGAIPTYKCSLLLSGADTNMGFAETLMKEIFAEATHVFVESIDQVYPRRRLGASMATHLLKSQEMVTSVRHLVAAVRPEPPPHFLSFPCREARIGLCGKRARGGTPSDRDVKAMLRLRLLKYPGGLTNHQNDALVNAMFGYLKWNKELLQRR